MRKASIAVLGFIAFALLWLLLTPDYCWFDGNPFDCDDLNAGPDGSVAPEF